jgi:hypothetical protein
MRSAFTFVVLSSLCALTAASAFATVYKCQGEGGQPVYQDSPCAPGRELRNFDQNPVEIGVVPMTPTPGAAAPAPAGKDARSRAATEAGRKTEMQIKQYAAERRFIRPGMTEAEVTAKVGPPDMTTPKGRRSSRWNYLPAAGDPQTITTVVFDNGKVIEVERKVVP